VIEDGLRDWQRDALSKWTNSDDPNFLLCSAPGTGKTIAALAIAERAIASGRVDQIIAVSPQTVTKRQWTSSLDVPLQLANNDVGRLDPAFLGYSLTYQQVSASPGLWRIKAEKTPTLVILDEPHHIGDELTWGKDIGHAFEPACLRVLLSGTPHRTDGRPIPWVNYRDGVAVPDFAYAYGAAVADGVCRKVEFRVYDGDVKYTYCGRVVETSISDSVESRYAKLQTAFDPSNRWFAEVFQDADKALDDLRTEVPDAAGLIVADDQEKAKAYQRILLERFGVRAELVTSDVPRAAHAIKDFRHSTDRWIIAVKMITEGVDIPRLMVCLFLSSTRTPLFFQQTVGRITRRRLGETPAALFFMPDDLELCKMGEEIERLLLGVLKERRDPDPRERDRDRPDSEIVPLDADNAAMTALIADGDKQSLEKREEGVAICRALNLPEHYAANFTWEKLERFVRERPRGQAAPRSLRSVQQWSVQEQKEQNRKELDQTVGSRAREIARQSYGWASLTPAQQRDRIADTKIRVNTKLKQRFGERSSLTLEQIGDVFDYVETLTWAML